MTGGDEGADDVADVDDVASADVADADDDEDEDEIDATEEKVREDVADSAEELNALETRDRLELAMADDGPATLTAEM